MKFILIALCLAGCAATIQPPGITATYEAVCYNGQSDCLAAMQDRCHRNTFPLRTAPSYTVIGVECHPEGNRDYDYSVIRCVDHYVCNRELGAK